MTKAPSLLFPAVHSPLASFSSFSSRPAFAPCTRPDSRERTNYLRDTLRRRVLLRHRADYFASSLLNVRLKSAIIEAHYEGVASTEASWEQLNTQKCPKETKGQGIPSLFGLHGESAEKLAGTRNKRKTQKRGDDLQHAAKKASRSGAHFSPDRRVKGHFPRTDLCK